MIRRKIKITVEKKQSRTWPYNPQEIAHMYDKISLPKI